MKRKKLIKANISVTLNQCTTRKTPVKSSIRGVHKSKKEKKYLFPSTSTRVFHQHVYCCSLHKKEAITFKHQRSISSSQSTQEIKCQITSQAHSFKSSDSLHTYKEEYRRRTQRKCRDYQQLENSSSRSTRGNLQTRRLHSLTLPRAAILCWKFCCNAFALSTCKSDASLCQSSKDTSFQFHSRQLCCS